MYTHQCAPSLAILEVSTLFAFFTYFIMMKCNNPFGWVAFALTIIGGLNWGLVGAFDLDLVNLILGSGIIADIVYILVGLSAVYMLIAAFMKKEDAAPMQQM
jgi:uncharacterized membrane protein YuzA (DUF378 family)